MIGKFFWSLYAFCYDVLLKFRPYQEMLHAVLEKLDLKEGQKIMDAGCGTGNLTALIKNKWPWAEVTVVDFSQVMLAIARKKTAGRSGVSVGSVDFSVPLLYPDNSFGFIASVNVLHALPNPAETIKELRRVLKRGGKMVIVALKDGYQLPLILKAHRHDYEPIEKWQTKNLLIWFCLVFKAFGPNLTALKFIFIAIFNKAVDKEIKGFKSGELERIFSAEGLILLKGCTSFIFL